MSASLYIKECADILNRHKSILYFLSMCRPTSKYLNIYNTRAYYGICIAKSGYPLLEETVTHIVSFIHVGITNTLLYFHGLFDQIDIVFYIVITIQIECQDQETAIKTNSCR